MSLATDKRPYHAVSSSFAVAPRFPVTLTERGAKVVWSQDARISASIEFRQSRYFWTLIGRPLPRRISTCQRVREVDQLSLWMLGKCFVLSVLHPLACSGCRVYLYLVFPCS